jgi:hypothetical protein
MESDAVKGFHLSWVRAAARDVTLYVCFAGFAPMTALAEAVEPVSSPFIDVGTLPRELTHLSQLAAQIDNFRGSQVQKSESDQWSELWNRL